jgi:predicted acyl esterase
LIEHEAPQGMQVDWDVAIEMEDGIVLRADIYRPAAPGRYPVLMSYGPYAKGLPFEVGYPAQYQSLQANHPEIFRGTSARYFNWETVDPERWVPDGYICIRVDSRGAGRSEGVVDPWSSREAQDYYQCIEWAAAQPWCSGKVGLAGVSYFATNQWHVAALRPPHLAAICPFEGFNDYYREGSRHGGILNTFFQHWYPAQIVAVQNGLGTRGRVNPNTHEHITGPAELTEDQMKLLRVDMREEQLAHPLNTDYYQSHTGVLENIEVPVLSCGNWGGHGLHLRGNVEGYLHSGSDQKWLELHGLEHWTEFYTDYGVALQKQFFDRFLKGADNGWDKRSPISLKVRTAEGFVDRPESEWPLARTRWEKKFLDAATGSLLATPPDRLGTAAFKAMEDEVHFRLPAFDDSTEITGPIAATLFVSSTTTDADLFVTLRAFRPDGKEHLFLSAVDPNAPMAQGWLRASHRKLDHKKSTPWQPVHTHDELQPLVPNEVYELNVEIWPSCFVFPAGYQLVLSVGGKDFDHGLPEPMPQVYGQSQRGCSVFRHNDPRDRPSDVFGGTTTLHSGPEFPSFLLLPFIPAK